jgi:hypothetical protein
VSGLWCASCGVGALNACTRGQERGLGFLVHEGGIEVGKKSMKAIDEVVPPTNLKELQSLLGNINFVKRFISNLSQKGFAVFSIAETKERSEVHMGRRTTKGF